MKYIRDYTVRALVLPVLLMVSLISCMKDEYNSPVSSDTSKPGVVTNIKIDNFNGGAHITYTLPKSSNLLYVMAQYKINDKTIRETKSSYYTDTITVEGFAQSQDYEVTLYSVSRANVKSDPLVVQVHPKTPYYQLVQPSIAISPDFSGVNIRVLNPQKKSIGVILVAIDSSTHVMEVQDQHYTNVDSVNYSVRGFASKSAKFGVYIADQYGNISDTTLVTLTPFFEKLMDKSKFFVYKLPSDSRTAYGWETYYLWDGKYDIYAQGWHTTPGDPPPMQCTFGMGASAKLSRFVMWERPGEYAYSHGNPKNFSIWGSNSATPQDAILPKYAPLGTVMGDWVNLGTYHYPDPPSGNQPGFVTADDQAFVLAGVNFNVPISCPAVRYIRVLVADTWSGGDFAHIVEFSFYGNPQ
ncbi:MAG: DUF5000 domain-containing lipoprotein [Bacteroidota bacterium]|nr:DUF5000 domain-containing lipoprotein [Bacteroidota bacterium]